VYADQGRLDDAQRLGQVSLANVRAILSPQHPKVSAALNMLALIRVMRRDFAGAVPQQEAVVQSLVATLGEDHPNSLTAKNNKHDNAAPLACAACRPPCRQESLRRSRTLAAESLGRFG
jgi:hypothetical protein